MTSTTPPVISVTEELLAELEQAASNASSGPWSVQPGHYPSFIEVKGPAFKLSIVTSATDLGFPEYMKRTSDAQHIAAANPATVLALIARVRELEEGYRSIISDHEFCLANGDTWGSRREAYVETARKLLPSPPKEGV